MSIVEEPVPAENIKHKIVSYCESRRFMIDCFKAVKVPQSHSEQMADLLVHADYVQQFNSGINSLELCIHDILFSRINGAAIPKILNETLATAWVDGENGLGAVIGNFCINLAITKAKQCGLGLVSVKRSNFYGMASFYTKKALNEGLIGISMTNTAPVMIPTRSKEPTLGTNPLSFSVPANADKFCFDMSPTITALGKIEIPRRECIPIPKGWVQDEQGSSQAKYVLPLGGSEENSGYKGYGLSALVDILSGVLSGANYSTKKKIQTRSGYISEANLGHLFIVLDPSFFLTDFQERMADFNSILRSCLPIDPAKPVLIPGDISDMKEKSTDAAGGIEYLETQLEICDKLATEFNVKPLQFLVKPLPDKTSVIS